MCRIRPDLTMTAPDPRLLLLAAGLSLATTLALVPLVKRVTFALGYVSRPRDDRWTSTSRPTAAT